MPSIGRLVIFLTLAIVAVAIPTEQLGTRFPLFPYIVCLDWFGLLPYFLVQRSTVSTGKDRRRSEQP